ncbi:hypothetical protein [Nocardioides campestrisoli]|uniref:hypothetical protein n=1 Tax=Nocardioides campestrisoli TaxID=2736757 RepID=UPI00163D9E40|nr:hypothetical protein [Nocardioides campestrisoli]
MEPEPSTATRPDHVNRLRRPLIVGAAVVLAIAAVTFALRAGIQEDPDPRPSTAAESTEPAPRAGAAEETPASEVTEVTEGGTTLQFAEFPLDLGWAETYGSNMVAGPSKGVIFMPEGHCDEGILYHSDAQDRLWTYVSDDEGSRNRAILGFADASAARATFRALRAAVTDCGTYSSPYTSDEANSAEVYDAIDEANARAGTTTFTFAYTFRASDRVPMSDRHDKFGVLYQFALVDRVLYGSNQYAGWTRRSAREGALTLDEENAPLVALLPGLER